MDADYRLGGFWGHHIDLCAPKDFHKLDLNKDTVELYGHWPKNILVGQTVIGEFQKSWIVFEITEIKYCSDPTDMFFAKSIVVKQKRKSDGVVIIVERNNPKKTLVDSILKCLENIAKSFQDD